MTEQLPGRVKVVEVGPRDGLQNEQQQVPTETKIELVLRLADAGLPVVEATSFVSPRWIPQLADAEQVMAGIGKRPDTVFPVLVPNIKGLERAVLAGAGEIAVFTAASEEFNRKNINAGIQESMVRIRGIAEQAGASGLRVRGYVSCVLGCPYQGQVATETVVDIARQLVDAGCYEVSLGDTIGSGTPVAARNLVQSVAEAIGLDRIAVHFHDTRGQALANVFACLEAGVSTVDASVAGLGGCPYARGATGNLATEDLVYMLHGMGIATGVDLDALVAAGLFISDALGRPPASRIGAIAERERAATT
ncbi:MAG: hydroxymethylglutaryl-CoA lyase [Gammaproteobacteria bacterium SG8_31]|nr:MAG: hydroxymethylglutaryl-CoA lyase [Gammaproteobacteria bacterium SG8_31]